MNTCNENESAYNKSNFNIQDKNNVEECSVISPIMQMACTVISLFLTPFYCTGLILTFVFTLIIIPFRILFHVLIFWQLPDNEKTGETNFPDKTEDVCIETDEVKTEKNEKHSKLIACPNCEHLHYTMKNCKCWKCKKHTPRILECYKYHKSAAQVLMCPCVDCKHMRPSPEVCDQCVLISQKIHVQAKTHQDIEIKTRPKRRK